jgi:hypothetical protein
VPCFLRAVTLDREMGNRYDLAMALAHLGETYASTGDSRGAREAWDESLHILRTLHHPAAIVVKGQLASLEVGGPAPGQEVLGMPDARQVEAARDAGAALLNAV